MQQLTFNETDTSAWLIANGFQLDEVVESSQTGRVEGVWDFHVENAPTPHTFLVDDVVTHNSVDSVFLGNLLSTISKVAGSQMTAGQIFGIQNPKTGKWDKPPIFRLYSESVGDAMFDAMSSLARIMPDKVYSGGKWWYVFNDKPSGMVVNAKMSSRGEYYVEAKDGYAEMVVFCDSYPFMYPESLDEDGKGAGMAAVARMFSANIPKLMGKLKKKGIAVIGVNQVRLKPGVSYGNPEYEPGGQAVQFASSIRIRTAARSVPHGKGPVEEEASVLADGNDQYKYILMKLTKNKSATSVGLESWQRVWASDPMGNAYGFCPVWNMYDYMCLTGQATRFGSGKKRQIMINLWSVDGEKVAYVNEKMTFEDLKNLVLLEGAERVAYAKEMKMSKEDYATFFSGSKLFLHLKAQVACGTGLSFAYALKNGATVGNSDSGTEENEDEQE